MTEYDQLLEVHADDPPFEGVVDSLLIARDLLIERARLERKVELVKSTAALIARDYADRVAKAEERISEIRQQLQLYIEQNGPVSFPELGSAHLRKTPDKVVITDPASFAEYAKECGETFERPMFDRPAAQAWALLKIRADGDVPPGTEFIPEGTGITIKGPA